MKTTPRLLTLFSSAFLFAGLSMGCSKDKGADSPDMLDKDGPMEKAGESVDDAADDAEDAVDDAVENTEDAVDDAN